MFTSWHTARLSMFHDGKLSPLKDELARLKPTRRQTPEEMLAALRAIQSTMKH